MSEATVKAEAAKDRSAYEVPRVIDFGPIHELTKAHKTKVGGRTDVPQGKDWPGSHDSGSIEED